MLLDIILLLLFLYLTWSNAESAYGYAYNGRRASYAFSLVALACSVAGVGMQLFYIGARLWV